VTAAGSSALKTDHYELTMLEAALASGVAARPAAFEAFARKLPPGRRYGVVGGVGRIADAIEAFRFGDEELAHLRDAGFLQPSTLDFLAAYRFGGTVTAYREGELYFPFSPIVTVEATFAEAVLLETVVLSILNHDSSIASAAARMVDAADGRPLLEMGGRRTDDDAAVHAARTAYLCGFAGTSNLEAGRRYGIPTSGTSAHAFTLAHDDELAAFRAQVAALGPGTTLLVDTYDIPSGIRNAVTAAGPELGAIRIDSGDLAEEAVKARRLLDELGATGTRIVVSSDMDEYSIDELVSVGAPIDGFGVGTRLVTGSGHPTAGMVYKLVAIDGRPVAKRSVGKISVGGTKAAWRRLDADGRAVAEEAAPVGTTPPAATRPLQVTLVKDGEVRHRPALQDIRVHHRAALTELDPLHRMILAGEPAMTTTIEGHGS